MSKRRPSKSLLDDLEEFAEEQEASERSDEDLYDEEAGRDVSDQEEEDAVVLVDEVAYGYEEVDYDQEEEEDEVVGAKPQADISPERVASSIRSGNASSLDALYEDNEDVMSIARLLNESSRSFGTGTTPPGSADFSLASAPARSQRDATISQPGSPQKRRSTVFGKHGDGDGKALVVQAHPSPSRRDSHRSSRSTRISFITAPRKSTFGGSASSKDSLNHRESLIEAAERLGSAESNTQWENVMAAAAVVTASCQAPTKRSHVQFGRGDHVLVILSLLNITSPEDVSKELFSVDPVNVFGYPRSEGHSEADRQGPYSYVLCKVQQVHFEEDQRYYTVLRLDTETEQRAEPSWMEPLKTSPEGDNFERALLAAQRTARSMAGQKATARAESTRGWIKLMQFVQTKLIPWYNKSRASFKKFVDDLLHGHEGYSMQLHCTGINLLVLCSLVYVFIDLVALAFLPTDMDKPVAITAIIVWCVLVMELFFEFLIRPSNYFELIHSDKAFAPATARHINRFHLFFETCGLILYLPSIGCSFTENYCWDNIWFNHIDAALYAVKGTDQWKACWSRFSLGLIFLRCFCLLRHWKQMWIITMFKGKDTESLFVRKLLLGDRELKRKQKDEEDDTENTVNVEDEEKSGQKSNENDNQLKDAATIGTALMLVNSHRALILGLLITTVFPMIQTIGAQNSVVSNFVDLFQANNRIAPTNSTEDCDYLASAALSFLRTAAFPERTSENLARTSDSLLLWAQVLPVRCDWQDPDGVITICPPTSGYAEEVPICKFWNDIRPPYPENATRDYFAEAIDVRASEVVIYERSSFRDFTGELTSYEFFVRAVFDESNTVAVANSAIFLLVLGFLMLSLIGLTVMRGDADRLVLGPLQRMLKIVVKYADDPLSQTASTTSQKNGAGEKEQLGNYETEQLINAIAKIADLLRKCWGVAGAGIISSNLARTKEGQTVVFNPTVPGKRVYALFGFVAINDFGKQLRALDKDVMRLINDVARVVHDEVYRWSLGDSGQCNKNLGPAFLMVFRIGDFSEVHDKKKRATDVVFNSQMKKNIRARKRRSSVRRRMSSRHFDVGKDGTLQLASLPGIQAFADRALLGMLKSFAGIHRDKNLLEWQNDFRLGAGVGAFKVNVIYGMDAGWAVEGAVGSEYKIDATYLSPHVNMASRMMSACKQYGVTVLLSQAVEELLSKTARTMLRHLDTVYVKGSSVPQRIYTYDARFDGVDFFLFERSPEQSDVEADSYSPSIWETDQDLRSMRQHVTDEFIAKFHDGVELYLEGRWKEAVETLQDADDLMLQTVLEEGYVDYKADDLGGKIFDRKVANEEAQRIRNEFGDGACKCLVQYMQRRKCIPPSDWHGVRKLMSK